ncbi:MAG: hypothetical protein LBK13_13765 [Spirochaetales bacterium]|jgi:hypothetical protein|nr:hypothetical protein [Spirochaetales bacterium]
MVKIVLVIDDADISLGDFFSYCVNKLKKIFFNNVTAIEFTSGKIKNDISINVWLEQIKCNFIFIALTHGSESELIGSNALPYVAVDINVSYLKNSFSFCFSCNAGKVLGKEIIDKGGLCFVGHNNTVYANNTGLWRELFSKPIVCFWEMFFSGETVFSCINKKKDEYNRIIDKIYETDMFHAMYLLNNRDSLVVYGNGHCCFRDFECI